MPIRDLTEDEESRLLSQSEVDSLANGTEVMVKWAGGNGPHRYSLKFMDGYRSPFAVLRMDEHLTYSMLLRQVGKNKFNDRVFILLNGEKGEEEIR